MRIFCNQPHNGRVWLNDTRKTKEKIVFRSSLQKRVDTSFTEDNLVGANNRKDLRKVFHSSASKLATHHEIDPIHNRDIFKLPVDELHASALNGLQREVEEFISLEKSNHGFNTIYGIDSAARIKLTKQDYIGAINEIERIKDHESRVPFLSGIISIARAVWGTELRARVQLTEAETKPLLQRGIESLNKFRDSELANGSDSGQLLRNVVANLFLGDYHEAEKILEPLIDFRDAEQKDKFYAKALYYMAFIEREQGKDSWEQTFDKAIEALGVKDNKVFSYEERHLLFLLRKFQAFKEKNPEIESFVSSLRDYKLSPEHERALISIPSQELSYQDEHNKEITLKDYDDFLVPELEKIPLAVSTIAEEIPELIDPDTQQIRSYNEHKPLEARLDRLTPGSPEWLKVYREMKPGDLLYEEALDGKDEIAKATQFSLKDIERELQEIISARAVRLFNQELEDSLLVFEKSQPDLTRFTNVFELASPDQSINRETVFDIEVPQTLNANESADAVLKEIDKIIKFFSKNQSGSPDREASLSILTGANGFVLIGHDPLEEATQATANSIQKSDIGSINSTFHKLSSREIAIMLLQSRGISEATEAQIQQLTAWIENHQTIQDSLSLAGSPTATTTNILVSSTQPVIEIDPSGSPSGEYIGDPVVQPTHNVQTKSITGSINPQPIDPSNLDRTIETVSKSLAEAIVSISNERFQELEQQITLINQQLEELRTCVGSSEASVVAAREAILKGLQLSLEEITSKFADLLKTQNANHGQNIEAPSRRIAKTGELLAKSVSAIVERLDNLSQADSASGTKIQELEKQLQKLSSSFQQLQESISSDTTTQELQSLAQRIEELSQRIDNLPETVSSPVNNSQEIADLRELVESLKQQLQELQNAQPSKDAPTTPPDDSAIQALAQSLKDAITRIDAIEKNSSVPPASDPAPNSSSNTDHTEEIKDLNAKLTTVTQQLTDEKTQAKDNKKKQDIFQIVGGSLALIAAGASGYSLMQSFNAQNSLQASLAALQNPSSGGLSVGLPATTSTSSSSSQPPKTT